MKRSIALLAVLVLAVGTISAEGLKFDFKGVRWNNTFIPVIPVPTGADVELGLKLADLAPGPLDATLDLGGGYEDLRLLRNPVSGDPMAIPASFDNAERYNSPNFQWALGLRQGLVKKDDGNLVEAFLQYRGRRDWYNTTRSGSAFSDLTGILGTSFLAGVAYDSVERDSHRVYSGAYAEASGEIGPAALNTVVGGEDFWRLDAKAKGFLPLLAMGQASDEKLNLFSVYLAGYASVDYAAGSSVPIYVEESFGGRELRDSLGSCVRGYPGMSYDSAFKAVANAEVRAVGPALFGQAWFVPVAYAFFDAGCYDGMPNSQNHATASGAIASVGGGLAVNLFDFAYLGVVLGSKIPGSDGLYSIYADTDPFFWAVKFALHF